MQEVKKGMGRKRMEDKEPNGRGCYGNKDKNGKKRRQE